MSHDDEETDAYNAAYREALLKRYSAEGKDGNNHDSSYYNEFKRTLNNNNSLQFGNMDSSSDLDYSDSNYTDRADKSFRIHHSDSDSEEKLEEQLNEEMLEEDSEDNAKDYLIDDLLDTKSKSKLNDTEYSDGELENDVPYSDDYDSEFDDDSEDDILYNEPKFQWFRFMVLLLLVTIIVPLFPTIFKIGSRFNKSISTQSFNSQSDITATFGTLQKQINHLYNELSIRDEKQKDEFDQKIKIIISQFEKNIKKLIPKKLLSFQDEITRLNHRLDEINNSIEMSIKQTKSNAMNTQEIEKLKTNLMNNIDLSILENTATNSTEKNTVEFKEYVSSFIIALFQEVNGNIINDYESFQENIHQYIDEITTEKLITIDNTDMINELKRYIEEKKVELWHEMKEYITTNNYQTLESQSSDQISTNFLKKLILQIYNSNRYQWENDLDFATVIQGSVIIPSLTSQTYKKGNGLKPSSLLSDTAYYSPSSYWQCSISSGLPCQIGIQFNRAIYLTRLYYIHGRLINNLHIMNSAPHDISIYIMLKNDKLRNVFIKEAMKHNVGTTLGRNPRFIKIGTISYDLENMRIRQNFELPLWYINLKPLISGILFQIDNNYGNEEYVSLKKFIVNGIIETDLNIIKTGKFPLDFKGSNAIPQYNSEDLNDDNDKKLEIKSSIETRHGNVASFGEDQPV
ncbi:hypothetical protein C6P45_003779 [Maudiozyma exigua]|uniref:SUN domain-containing protein n=1 Tax=Maudiozyma exigua TaxID=34358 RepID=A0A9P6WBP5_MAUEX|nr:hypothetical protein C6P45_003779 [Kazachstania exigua]